MLDHQPLCEVWIVFKIRLILIHTQYTSQCTNGNMNIALGTGKEDGTSLKQADQHSK